MIKRILIINILITLVTGSLFAHIKADKPERVINISYTIEKGPLNEMFKKCVGAGRANEGLRADWQQQLAYVKKECGFKYIRFHGLLCDDMGVYKEDTKGNPIYNYMYIDALFDFLHSIDIKPFVEFGFMPNALASVDNTIFWWKGNVTPPKDYNKWKDLISNLTQHWTDRYGEEEVKTWYFEVWNEPNLSPWFWTGTMEEYFKLYEYTVRGVKSVNSDYRVGGPATAGAAWEDELIEFCETNDVAIDFISTHSYGVKQGYLDEFGQMGTVLDRNPMSVSQDILQSRKEIDNSAKPHLELHYTEWSASYTPADPIHDSYHEAAFVLQKIKQSEDAVNSMSYWVFTDIFEEAGPRFKPFHGGFGMLNTQGINKPVFYSYQFLNKLRHTELANKDEMSWITKDKEGNISALIWDFTITHPGDSVINQIYYTRDLPSKFKGKLNLNIDEIPEGTYALEVYKVGYRSNDTYTTYLDMGKPANLTKQQVEQIKSQNDGSPFMSEIIHIKKGTNFSKTLDIRENDVFLLNIIKL